MSYFEYKMIALLDHSPGIYDGSNVKVYTEVEVREYPALMIFTSHLSQDKKVFSNLKDIPLLDSF
jgi:hypothetical protein